MSKQRLYILLAMCCIAGGVWLVIASLIPQTDFRVCIFRQITGLPCPACGSTRAVIEIFRGNLSHAFQLNPNGYILTSIAIVTPLWLLFDWMTKGDSLFRFYNWVEQQFTRKPIIYSALLLVLINWIWNIYKGV